MSSERIERLLADIRLVNEEHYSIAQTLRDIILSAGSHVTEEIKYGGMLFSSAVPFCGVFTYARHVSLEFSNGAALPDPHQFLEGGGKLRRHIKLLNLSDIAGKHVREYVPMAFQAAGQPR